MPGHSSPVLRPTNNRGAIRERCFETATDKRGISNMHGLSKFFVDLAHVWAEPGIGERAKLGPFLIFCVTS